MVEMPCCSGSHHGVRIQAIRAPSTLTYPVESLSMATRHDGFSHWTPDAFFRRAKTSKGRKADFARAANRDGSHEPVLCFLTGQVKIGTAKELCSESIVSFQTQYVNHV